MPANMISEPPGSSLWVTGRRRATVSAGPMPGRTPTAVPSSTPISAYKRFIGWTATAKPWASEASVSTMSSVTLRSERQQPFERARRQRQRQQLVEQQKHHGAEHAADQQVDHEGAAPERRRRGGEQDGGGQNESAAKPDQRDERRQPAEDEQDRFRIGRLRLRQAGGERHHQVADG